MATTEIRNGTIIGHRMFPALVALWFAALFGLGSLAVRPALIERAVRAPILAAAFPAATPPASAAVRIGLALVLAVFGAGLGASIARRLAARTAARTEGEEAPAPARRRPLAVDTAAPTSMTGDAAAGPEEAPQVFDIAATALVNASPFAGQPATPAPGRAQAPDARMAPVGGNRHLDIAALANRLTAALREDLSRRARLLVADPIVEVLPPAAPDDAQVPAGELRDDELAEDNFSSLLGGGRQVSRGDFVRIELPEPDPDGFGPVVIFPGQVARSFAAPATERRATAADIDETSASDAPRDTPRDAARALGEALAALQRINGAA